MDMSAWFGGKDLPNWLTLLVSLGVGVISAFVAKWWARRRHRFVPGLEVVREKSSGKIDGAAAASIKFRFLNKTGSVVHIQHPQLRAVTKHLALHAGTWTDSATGSCELKFLNPENRTYERRHTTIETHAEAETDIFVATSPDLDVLNYTAPRWRRLFRCPKYFILEYVVIVGARLVRVRTIC